MPGQLPCLPACFPHAPSLPPTPAHPQVSKEKDNANWLFAGFRLFMDWLQLFLLTVNPQYGYNIDTTNL